MGNTSVSDTAPWEQLKPVDITGVDRLTEPDRRIYDLLIKNAIDATAQDSAGFYHIDMEKLKGAHDSSDRVQKTIDTLINIAVCHRLPNGALRQFPLLGSTCRLDPNEPPNDLAYSFDPRLEALVKDGTVAGILEMQVLQKLKSKYAVALYEHVVRLVAADWDCERTYTIDELRDIMVVEYGKMLSPSRMKERALLPALKDINEFAPFQIDMEPHKEKGKFARVTLKWRLKTDVLARMPVATDDEIRQRVHDSIHNLGA